MTTLTVNAASNRRRQDLLLAAQRVMLLIFPLALTGWMLALALHQGNFALDFTGWFRPAGVRVLHGVSPYDLPTLQAFDYFAPSALGFVPFALLPAPVAQWAWEVLVFGCVPGTLWALRVRDWRIYAAVLLWQPVIVGWAVGNVSLPLAFGCALAWRWRDRPAMLGLVVAAVLSVKLNLLPLAAWLVMTRRWRATAWMVGAWLALNAVAWSVLGWDQVGVYLHQLHAYLPAGERRGYSLISFALHLGAGHLLAYAVALGLAGVLVLRAVLARGANRDREILTAVILAMLLGSPVVDVHYLALMVVPLALARPRFGWPWALPFTLLVVPADHPVPNQQALVLLVFGVITAVCLERRRGRGVVAAPVAEAA